MAAMQTTDTQHTQAQPSRLKRLGWFIGIWAASALALAVVSYGFKALLPF
ncbi:MAG: DUF2474 family protein [Parvibaculaceae bacterium]